MITATFTNTVEVLSFSLWLSANCRKKVDLNQVDGWTYAISAQPDDASLIAGYISENGDR